MQDRSQFAADVVVGIDVAKGKHFVCALTTGGERLFSRPVPNDEGAIRPPTQAGTVLPSTATQSRLSRVVPYTGDTLTLLSPLAGVYPPLRS